MKDKKDSENSVDFDEFDSSTSNYQINDSESTHVEPQNNDAHFEDLFNIEKPNLEKSEEEEDKWSDSNSDSDILEEADKDQKWVENKNKIEYKTKSKTSIKKIQKVFQGTKNITKISVDENSTNKITFSTKEEINNKNKLFKVTKDRIKDFINYENEIFFIVRNSPLLHVLKNEKVVTVDKKLEENKLRRLKNIKIDNKEFLFILGNHLHIFDFGNLNLFCSIQVLNILDFCYYEKDSILVVTREGNISKITIRKNSYESKLLIANIYSSKEIYYTNKKIIVGVQNGIKIFDESFKEKTKTFEIKETHKVFFDFNFCTYENFLLFCFKKSLKIYDMNKNSVLDTIKDIKAENIALSQNTVFVSYRAAVLEYLIK